LPEIYRIRDAEALQPGQLAAYLAAVETVYGGIWANIEALYRDLFIETAADWVVPYIGDLLGVSPLSGDPQTLRADVADTIALRRRKGTLASIDRLVANLTQWAAHCVELRDRLVWNQHLNHQRPDSGGEPPLAQPGLTRFSPARGGTVNLRDPAQLSLLDSPFNPFAHLADVRPPGAGGAASATAPRYNLPNLAIFLWRLAAYRVRAGHPLARGKQATGLPAPAAAHVARFDVHPQGEPVRLFNVFQDRAADTGPGLTALDEVPGPIPAPRLNEGAPAGNPQAYVAVDSYDPAGPVLAGLNLAEVGLQFHLPEPEFAGQTWPLPRPSPWKIRAANLCAWESGLFPPLAAGEIAIDPEIGRFVIGVGSNAAAQALLDRLLLTWTYAAPGPVGAHPVSRPAAPQALDGQAVTLRRVNFHQDADGLRQALANLDTTAGPVVVEIEDSMTHALDLDLVAGRFVADGQPALNLAHSLIIRAAGGQRPVIRLVRPLRFRPAQAAAADGLLVRLEGLYLTRAAAFPAGEALVSRAALNALEMDGCTLDPGGYRQLNGNRAAIWPALDLRRPYGFADPAEEAAFDQTPRVSLFRCLAGPLLLDRGYSLSISDCVVDAGAGVGDNAAAALAIGSATAPAADWGAPLEIHNATLLGRARPDRINGRGAVFVHTLDVLDNQQGCLRYSYFSGQGDRLPQNLGCVAAPDARLRFVAETFGSPAYALLALGVDFRLRERGPGDDAMGAYNFLCEGHKWRNLQVRFREFMPVGVRPLLIPIT
jgi:hypothetical protein